MNELQEAIEQLRHAGAARLEPVRFAYLQALSRRMAGHEGQVQHLLRTKLAASLADCRERLAATVVPAQDASSPRQRTPAAAATRPGAATTTAEAATHAGAASTPLAQLTARLNAVSAERHDGMADDEPRQPDELPSARRFRQAWNTAHTLEQVQQALARKPAQAGPLNSHALVVESLALMRCASPEYLRRFLQYAESLQWLEQARAQVPRAQAKPAKPARRSRRKA
jgi:hypothetical protein